MSMSVPRGHAYPQNQRETTALARSAAAVHASVTPTARAATAVEMPASGSSRRKSSAGRNSFPASTSDRGASE
jgi:hypothetical protein